MAKYILAVLICIALCGRGIAAGKEAVDSQLLDAVMNLDVQHVREALEQGADPNSFTHTKRPQTVLNTLMFGMTAKRNGEGAALEIAKLLFAKGARLGPYDSDILFSPISDGSEPMLGLLLDKGASPTLPIEGYTPAELAIKYGHPPLYNLLVKRGAVPVHARDAAQLVLVQAAGNGDIEGMEQALASGARVDGPDPSGATPLLSALHVPLFQYRQAAAVWWLLDHHADPNATGESGFTDLAGIPLHVFVAMNARNMAMVRPDSDKPFPVETLVRLLNAGAKVSGMDEFGRTPLHIAAKFDNEAAARILIGEGARVMARDKSGRTPLDYAEAAGMIKLLEASGAREE